MATNTAGWPKAGDKVLIFTSERSEDPNEYIITGMDGRVMILNGPADTPLRVNISRLRQIMTTDTSAPVPTVKEETPVAATATKTDKPPKKVTIGAKSEKPAEKAKPEKTPSNSKKSTKPNPIETAGPIDLDSLVNAGHEIWTKTCKFNHKSVVACAHIMFALDKKSYVAFNTYNGAVSAKRKKNVKLNKFKIEGGTEGLEQKRQELAQEGYSAHKTK